MKVLESVVTQNKMVQNCWLFCSHSLSSLALSLHGPCVKRERSCVEETLGEPENCRAALETGVIEHVVLITSSSRLVPGFNLQKKKKMNKTYT